MTDSTEPEVEELDETVLTTEQEARVAALWQARGLLTGGGKVSAPFSSAENEAPLGKVADYPSDLLMVSEYILSGLLAAELDEVVFDETGCDAKRCACRVAAEFTTGENTVTASALRPEGPDGRVVLIYDGAEYFSHSYVRDHPEFFSQPDATEPLPGWGVPEPDTSFDREVGGPTLIEELPSEGPAIATESELYRHAQKQDVSLRDAWSYFRDQGYDMRNVGSYEFDSTVPNEKEIR